MTEDGRIEIVVASTFYGYEDQFNQICGLFEQKRAQCKELGFKEPVWNQKDNTVNVVFPDVKVPFNYSEGITEGITEGLRIFI